MSSHSRGARRSMMTRQFSKAKAQARRRTMRELASSKCYALARSTGISSSVLMREALEDVRKEPREAIGTEAAHAIVDHLRTAQELMRKGREMLSAAQELEDVLHQLADPQRPERRRLR